MAYYTIVAATFGAVLGSFFNVVGLRVPKKQSIAYPPSHCVHCERRLTALDLVPIFSYVFLGGKCRSCKTKISPIYPVMELITALLFAFSYYKIGWQPELFVVLAFMSLFVIITVSDVTYMIIPDKVLLVFGILLAVGRVLSPLEIWWSSIAGAVLGFSLLLLIAVVSKGGMGGGDIKLFFVIGLVLGVLNTLLTLFLAAVIGLIFGVALLIKNKKRAPIPFGPAIAIAAVIVYFYGTGILQWYSSII